MSGIFFSPSRNIELSTLDYLEAELEASWSNVTILKSFSRAFDKSINPPIICIRLESSQPFRREIGTDTLDYMQTILIDIFAKSDAQRIDLAHFITDKLKDGYPFYQFSHQSGNKQVLEKTQTSTVRVMSWDGNTKLDFGQNVDTKERYRHLITVSVRTFL